MKSFAASPLYPSKLHRRSPSSPDHHNLQTSRFTPDPSLPLLLIPFCNSNCKWLFSNPKADDGGEIEKSSNGVGGGGDDEGEGGFALKGTILERLFLVGVVWGFGAAGYVCRDQVNAVLNQFTTLIEARRI